MTATIEIPPTLTEALAESLGAGALPKWGLEALVLSAVGQGLITTGHASELLGLGYFETLALLRARGVPNKMTEEEFEAA